MEQINIIIIENPLSPDLFEEFVLLAPPSFLHLAPPALLRLSDAALSLGEHRERVNASLLLQADQFLAEEVEHVSETLSL